jgi:hypothetical protein
MSGTNEQAKFLSGNLTKHIISMSLTSAIGFLALFVVDLVDMLFKPAVSRAMYEGRLWAVHFDRHQGRKPDFLCDHDATGWFQREPTFKGL